VQASLLRVIENGESRRLGEHQARKIDVRLIAATHKPLESLIEKQTFRQDLYFRLAALHIETPPCTIFSKIFPN
jgi:DNA-binding NtrC family response regulator